jgi:hypothetical protein
VSVYARRLKGCVRGWKEGLRVWIKAVDSREARRVEMTLREIVRDIFWCGPLRPHALPNRLTHSVSGNVLKVCLRKHPLSLHKADKMSLCLQIFRMKMRSLCKCTRSTVKGAPRTDNLQ